MDGCSMLNALLTALRYSTSPRRGAPGRPRLCYLRESAAGRGSVSITLCGFLALSIRYRDQERVRVDELVALLCRDYLDLADAHVLLQGLEAPLDLMRLVCGLGAYCIRCIVRPLATSSSWSMRSSSGSRSMLSVSCGQLVGRKPYLVSFPVDVTAGCCFLAGREAAAAGGVCAVGSSSSDSCCDTCMREACGWRARRSERCPRDRREANTPYAFF